MPSLFSGPPGRLAAILWLLLTLFVLRVAGQALVAFLDVRFLPPMGDWYSGLMPYRYLLPAQLLIIVLLAKVSLDFSRGGGFFMTPRPLFARGVLYFGCVYLAGMVLRYPLTMWLRPELRWFGGTIPIFFHWVLACYAILFGLYHRRQRQRQGRG
jgi:hypothetical protein